MDGWLDGWMVGWLRPALKGGWVGGGGGVRWWTSGGGAEVDQGQRRQRGCPDKAAAPASGCAADCSPARMAVVDARQHLPEVQLLKRGGGGGGACTSAFLESKIDFTRGAQAQHSTAQHSTAQHTPLYSLHISAPHPTPHLDQPRVVTKPWHPVHQLLQIQI